MAREPQESPEERVRKSVARTIANLTVLLISLGVLGAWAYFGIYQLEPGQAAVILRFGKYVHTVSQPGLRWHLPPPIEDHEVVNVASIDREEFGYRTGDAEPTSEEKLEAAMQTSDANIVHLSFVVQYRIKDAFQARYRIADPRPVLRDAAQAAVRGVVGRNTIDDVLSEKRGIVETETQEVLQDTLDHYESGLAVLGIELQDVQPPESVRAAFDDVLGAVQDRNRTVNEAQGYANEVLPKSRAQSVELIESARGYRDARIAEATGQASRFRAIASEYQKAPEVVRTRLFLETMEDVLPSVRTVIVEPGTAVMPYLPLDERPKEVAK
ncbi:MAG: HflK protein [Deltaproteobacteria bacterium]|nr:HflK protein [Deltaproteobacteria bacterium]